MTTVRRNVLIHGFGLLSVMALAVGLLSIVEAGVIHPNFADALSYQQGVLRWLHGLAPYTAMQMQPYALQDAAWGAGFVYPPTALPFLALLAPGGLTFYLWNLLNVTAFATVALLIIRREWGPLGWIGWLIAAAIVFFQPGLGEVQEGQMSPLIAALVGLMWLYPKRSGYLSVFGAMFKLYPILGLLWARRHRAEIVIPLLLAAIPAIWALGVNGSSWLWYPAALVNAHAGCPAWSLPSLTCATGSSMPGYLVTAVLLVAAWRIRRDDVAFALLGLAMIAPAPDLYWGYWLIPFMAALPLGCRLIRYSPLRSAVHRSSRNAQPTQVEVAITSST